MLIRKKNLERLGKTPTELARILGKSVSYWRDLMRDPNKAFGEKIARYIEQEYPLPRLWLDQSHDEADPIPPAGEENRTTDPMQPPAQAAAMAHPVSQLVTQTVPSITWEQIKMSVGKDGLPPVFRVQMVDNAMAPRAGAGAWVQFSSTESARPGDGVLVRDALGNPYFRQYRAGRPGCWEAHADNSAFAPLDSERDGLEVLAVLTAVEARWG